MSTKYDAHDITTKYDITYLHTTKYDITTFIGHHILIALAMVYFLVLLSVLFKFYNKKLRVLIQRMYLFYVSTFCYLSTNITLTFTQSIVLDFRLFTCVNNLATSEDTKMAVVVQVLIQTTIAVDKWHSFDKMQNCKSLVNCTKIIIACRCISLL